MSTGSRIARNALFSSAKIAANHAVNVPFSRTHRRRSNLPALVAFVWTFVWTVVAIACSSSAPSPPTSIAGAWEGQLEDVRVRLDLIEGPSRISPDWIDVQGTGSLTPSEGRSVAIAPHGWNVQRSAGSPMVNGVLINFDSPDISGGIGYGQFNGNLVNGDLVGTMTLHSAADVVLFPDRSVARFTRP